MKIDYLRHHEIDKKAYDQCIENALHGTIYALSWYLDFISPDWELLKIGNYDFVMPLPVKKRFLQKYLIQPPFCQQLGIFSKEPLTQSIFDLFIRNIPYRYYDLQFNAGNCFEYPNITFQQNYFLELNRKYEPIREGYKTNCLRNIKKAEKENLVASNSTERQVYLDFLVAHAAQNRPILKMIPLLNNLLEIVGENSKTEIWHIENPDGLLLSCAFFFYWKDRMYLMGGVSSEEGRQKQGMSFLIDNLIQANVESDLILDFEGSSLPDLARFYEGFGATLETYPHIRVKNVYSGMYDLIKKIR